MFEDTRAKENLINLIKPLYDNADIKWTDEQEKEIEKFIQNISAFIMPSGGF